MCGVTSMKPPKTTMRLLAIALLDPKLACGKGRNERRMLRQDAERAVSTGRNDHVDIRLGQDDALARNDLNVKLGHGCRSSLSLASAADWAKRWPLRDRRAPQWPDDDY